MARATIAAKPKKRVEFRERPRRRDARGRAIVRKLAEWFKQNARPLPWRTNPRRAYPSLVSELMLQQTQVSRVLEKFEPFLQKFPTVESLAAADEANVLAAWSGLGYYRRARLLLACARAIAETHGGHVPRGVDALLGLPGIGRYTAGAIASIVFGEPAPIVDGNVCRVLQRLEARHGNAGEKRTVDWAWGRAEQLVSLTAGGEQVAAFNEGLMELGATVCTPERPRCRACPVRRHCTSLRDGLTDSIPAPKERTKRIRVYHDVVVVHRRASDGATEFLLEQRPPKGLWAGMWQPPARERNLADELAPSDLLNAIGVNRSARVSGPSEFTFFATHREIRFRIWRTRTTRAGTPRGCRWVRETELDTLAISNAHRRLLISES